MPKVTGFSPGPTSQVLLSVTIHPSMLSERKHNEPETLQHSTTEESTTDHTPVQYRGAGLYPSINP